MEEMQLRFSSNKLLLAPAALAAALILLPAQAAFGSTLIYTFTGVGSGSISGTTNATFTDATFTIRYTEDPTTVVQYAPGYYKLSPISGTFTQGTHTETFTNDFLAVNSNPDTGFGNFETVFLFNGDFGSSLGIADDATLLHYALASTIDTGVVTSNISAFSDPLGFTTSSGDKVEFSGLDSLRFTVSNPTATPEPSTVGFLTLASAGLLLVRRRVSRKA